MVVTAAGVTLLGTSLSFAIHHFIYVNMALQVVWLLIVIAAVSLFLCVNQQFNWRFFVGTTLLNTEYFYLLIALMLPFTACAAAVAVSG